MLAISPGRISLGYENKLERILLAFFICYAAWSLQTIGIVFWEAPFHFLGYSALTSTSLAAVAYIVIPIIDRRSQTTDCIVAYVQPLWVLIGGLIASGGAIAFIKTGSIAVFIVTVMLVVVLTLFPTSKSEQRKEELSIDPNISWIAVAAISVAFYLIANRPDGDDAHFVNLAVGARRFGEPLLAYDTMLGHGPGPIHLPTYRVHSFELLIAAIAEALSTPTIYVAHLVVPIAFVIVFSIAMVRMGYDLVSSDVIGAVILLLALQFATSSTFASWGIHGITRFFHGKAILITVVVPLLVYYGHRAVRDGRPIDYIMVTALNISGVGLTANAIFIAPIAAGLAGASAALAYGLGMSTVIRLIGVGAASTYPIAIGLWFFFSGGALPSEVTRMTLIGDALRFVTGHDVAAVAVIAAMAFSPIIARGLPNGRFFTIYAILSLVVLANPLLWPVYSTITGNLGSRIFWSVPVLHLVAVAATILLIQVLPRKPVLRIATCFAALLVAAVWNQTLPDNMRVDFHRPGLKVDEKNFLLAQDLVTLTQPNCSILAPEEIAIWITTIDNHPHPVAVRSLYLRHYRFTMPEDDLLHRTRLFNLVNGVSEAQQSFQSAITLNNRYRVGTIATYRSNPYFDQVSMLANIWGLSANDNADFVIWTGNCTSTPLN